MKKIIAVTKQLEKICGKCDVYSVGKSAYIKSKTDDFVAIIYADDRVFLKSKVSPIILLNSINEILDKTI